MKVGLDSALITAKRFFAPLHVDLRALHDDLASAFVTVGKCAVIWRIKVCFAPAFA